MIGKLPTPPRLINRKAFVEKVGAVGARPRRIQGGMLEELDKLAPIARPDTGNTVLHHGNRGFVIDGSLGGLKFHAHLLTSPLPLRQTFYFQKLDNKSPPFYIGYNYVNGASFMDMPVQTKLQEAFALTDTISYGRFMMKKGAGSGWDMSCFYVDGKKVQIKNHQKLIVALLISQRGEAITQMDVDREKGLNVPLENMTDTTRMHISLLRKAIKDTPGAEHAAEDITAVKLPQELRVPTIRPGEYLPAYKINFPSPETL